MGWTDPTARAYAELITAPIWNTDLVDNLKYLYDVAQGDELISSSPPASPALYQRWIYPVASGEHWTFVYRSDLDATYPWHYLAGSPLRSQGKGGLGTGGYAQLIAATTPRAGSYACAFGGDASIGGSGVYLAAYVGGAQQKTNLDGVNYAAFSWEETFTVGASTAVAVYGYGGQGGGQYAVWVRVAPVKIS